MSFQICSKKVLMSNFSKMRGSSTTRDCLRFKSSASKDQVHLEHCEKKESYGNPKLPENVKELEASQQMNFTQTRSRDVSGAHIDVKMNQTGNVFSRGIMGSQSSQLSGNHQPYDNHVGKYDCNNTVSLSSIVDGNVPTPFNTSGLPSPYHLGQPAGQRNQSDKYVAGDIQSHHYVHQSNKKPAK